MTNLADRLVDTRQVLETARAAGRVSHLSDTVLFEATSRAEELARTLDLIRVECAAEIARRSSPDLGPEGLAVRNGCRDATAMLRGLTNAGFQDASRRIRVGAMLADTPASSASDAGGEDPVAPATDLTESLATSAPLTDVADAVRSGRLGVDAADQIIRALAPVIAEVEPAELGEAVTGLLADSDRANADDIGKLARGVRDTLDRAGVLGREEQLRGRRSLRRSAVQEGLRRVTLVLDPESDAIFSGALDTALSPRLGGPRFTDTTQKQRAEQLLHDDRSTEQLALDVLIDLLRLGINADNGALLGATKPAVRITVPLRDLTDALDDLGRPDLSNDRGIAWLEGSDQPVSAATARRHLCDTGALPVILGGTSEPLDLGRTRRLFSPAQRVALAFRDGGCRWPGCDRPPAWCEAHHTNPFNRPLAGHPKGRTDLDQGILLCRRHHLLLHNHGWWIQSDKTQGSFTLVPPRSLDPTQTPRPIPSRQPPWLTRT